jgi:cell division protein FtsZ
VLINITGGEDLTLGEVTQISEAIHDAAGDEAEIIFGAVNDPAMHGEVRITVIATGFDRTGAMADAVAGVQKPAAGVLPFRDRQSRPTPTPQPGFVKPPETAPKRSPTQAPLNPELNEMEIPTFIRRQMD